MNIKMTFYPWNVTFIMWEGSCGPINPDAACVLLTTRWLITGWGEDWPGLWAEWVSSPPIFTSWDLGTESDSAQGDMGHLPERDSRTPHPQVTGDMMRRATRRVPVVCRPAPGARVRREQGHWANGILNCVSWGCHYLKATVLYFLIFWKLFFFSFLFLFF